MAKGKGFDPIADANELAQHNINPHYWVNRVTSYTYARWMAEKKVAVIYLPLYLIGLFAIIYGLNSASEARRMTIWQFFFTDWSSIYVLMILLFMTFLTGIALIMVLQLIFAPRKTVVMPDEQKQKKKKLPKHRKDYH